MCEVIVVTSGKGGVGKTTTSANIGTGLSECGKRVVMIDTDIGLRNLDVVIATNQGEPLVGNGTMSGKAYQNICHRILGEEIPIMDLEPNETMWKRFSGIFKRA